MDQEDHWLHLREPKDLVLKLTINTVEIPPEILGLLIKIKMVSNKTFLITLLIKKLKTIVLQELPKEMVKLLPKPLKINQLPMLLEMSMPTLTLVLTILSMTPLIIGLEQKLEMIGKM